MFPTRHCFENTVRKIGHHARKRDMMSQLYRIYACSGTFHRFKLQFAVAGKIVILEKMKFGRTSRGYATM